MWKDLPEGHTLRNISDLMFQEHDDRTWRHVYLEQSTHAELQKTSGYFGIRMVRSLQIRMKNWNIYRPTYEYELSYCLRNGQKSIHKMIQILLETAFQRNYLGTPRFYCAKARPKRIKQGQTNSPKARQLWRMGPGALVPCQGRIRRNIWLPKGVRNSGDEWLFQIVFLFI